MTYAQAPTPLVFYSVRVGQIIRPGQATARPTAPRTSHSATLPYSPHLLRTSSSGGTNGQARFPRPLLTKVGETQVREASWVMGNSPAGADTCRGREGGDKCEHVHV